MRRLGIELRDGKLHAPTATATYHARTRRRARVAARSIDTDGAPPAGEHVTYDEARRREAVANALVREREAALQAGSLVRADDVRASLSRRCVGMRDVLLNVAARLAPLLAVETDESRVPALLRSEMHAGLALLSAGEGAAP